MNHKEGGFSEKIKYPEFTRAVEHQSKTSFPGILCLFLAVIAMVLCLLLGIFHVITLSWSLIIGGSLGLLFVIFSFFQKSAGKSEDIYSDARVVRKKILRKKDVQSNDDLIYLVVFEKKDGREHKMNFAQHKALYHYYQTGDYVRFHPGFPYPEKRDKQFDSEVACVSCGKLSRIDDDRCRGCHLLLLK